MISMPIMRKVQPTLIAFDIVGVQPLSAPTRQIYGRQFRNQGNRKMTIKGYTFYNYHSKLFSQRMIIDKSTGVDLEFAFLQDNLDYFTKISTQKNVNQKAEVFKKNRKMAKAKVKRCTKRLNELRTLEPRLFI